MLIKIEFDENEFPRFDINSLNVINFILEYSRWHNAEKVTIR